MGRPGRAPGVETSEAAGLARLAAEAPPVAGRPLYGALRSLAWPQDDHLALWHAATLLREHRGDGHVAALTAEGLDGCEAHVTLAATGSASRQTLQSNRKWSDEEWAAAQTRLADRGWLHGGDPPTPTEQGRAGRQRIEDRTDALSTYPYEPLGEDGCTRLRALGRTFSKAVLGAGQLQLLRQLDRIDRGAAAKDRHPADVARA